jgi:hypothetical protein
MAVYWERIGVLGPIHHLAGEGSSSSADLRIIRFTDGEEERKSAAVWSRGIVLTQMTLWRLKCYKGKLLSNISGVTHLE